jgi:lipopolysaccharide/colanic/teichoic acid biosynthesis glycosyltransferase
MERLVITQTPVCPDQIGYRIAKRVMDVALCLLALPFVLPIMIICAVAIVVNSPGPVLFSQVRIGKGGRRFRMYKLRTMKQGLDDTYQRAFMKAFVRGEIETRSKSDSRKAFMKVFIDEPASGAREDEYIYKSARPSQVTQVGRILRKTSLDELPQIINVLKGEMSWVGPRPNVPWEVEEYQSWHYRRLQVLPGMTGLAQVRGRSCVSFDDIVRYDIEYLEKQSLIMDIKILWWTVRSVVDGKGAG